MVRQLRGRPIFYDSTPTHLVNHAVATMMSFSPRIHREPVGDTDQHKQDATDLEHGLKAVMDNAALQEPTLPWKMVAQYLIAHGYAVVEAPVLTGLADRPSAPVEGDYEDEEEFNAAQTIYRANRKSFNPVRIRVPHPSTVLMNPREKIPTMAIKSSKIMAQDLHEQSIMKNKRQRRRYSEIFDMGNRDPWDEVETWDYWTPYWHVKLVANPTPPYGTPASRSATPIWMEKNTWGFVPFVHAFSGWGMDIGDSGGDPSNFAHGILTPNKETIRKRTQEISAFHQILLRFAFAPMGTSTRPDDPCTGNIQRGNTGRRSWRLLGDEHTRRARMGLAAPLTDRLNPRTWHLLVSARRSEARGSHNRGAAGHP